MTQVEPYPVDHWPPHQFHPVYESLREWLDNGAPDDHTLTGRDEREDTAHDRP